MLEHVVKYATIIVGAIIAVIGYFAKDKITRIDETQTALWHSEARNTELLAQVSKDLAVIGASFQAHIKDDDHIDASIQRTLDDHESRLRNLSSIPLPKELIPPKR